MNEKIDNTLNIALNLPEEEWKSLRNYLWE